ncbi:MAG: NADH-quinone oxidoreductase subunit NuoF [Planctomycetes bacterium]|nr:NADH-quinone oxidoreductase subunit NuoF [Planctomycetota bacterium]
MAMATTFQPFLTRNFGEPLALDVRWCLERGAYEGARKALAMPPKAVIEEVKLSGLRGRGGAGFPCGMKWSFVPQDTGKPVYVVCNADESEPGTFKDRALIDRDPHQLLAGIIIACWAVQAHTAFIYIRGEMVHGHAVLEKAVADAERAGVLGDTVLGAAFPLRVLLMRGAGAYICGEETGLLTSLEGNRGYPRLKPPFPAVVGAFGCPTVVNNVETLGNLPHIMVNGARWHASMGTEKSPGAKVFSLSGHVKRPGNYEVPLGTPLMDLLDGPGGGVGGTGRLKAVIPGGSSAPILTAEDCKTAKLDYESIAQHGSMLGSGAVIVLDDSVCMVDAIWNLMRFYHHESGGQCTPCREGTGWVEKTVARIEHGRGRMRDLDVLLETCDNMQGKTICVLADAAAMPLRSYLKKFRAEFEAHITQGKCPFG